MVASTRSILLVVALLALSGPVVQGFYGGGGQNDFMRMFLMMRLLGPGGGKLFGGEGPMASIMPYLLMQMFNPPPPPPQLPPFDPMNNVGPFPNAPLPPGPVAGYPPTTTM